ncbi:MAG: hypothetical protein KTR22_08375 [Flavobacteriaceae bacterium]|nr:hypothetical protein [Flavobacteriaceae bacterium]
MAHIQKLPYGRNTHRNDLSLVLTENRGTCSSKHAFLKSVAIENNLHDVHLVLGLYKMNQTNTAGIGNILIDAGLDYIPEAHCYLRINGMQRDLTTLQADFSNIEKDLMLEKEITPDQITEFKVIYHKEFIKKWIKKESIPLAFDTIWQLREQCIEALSKPNAT